MEYKYLVAFGQPDDRAVYFTNQHTFHGDILLGGPEIAHVFNNIQEVTEYLLKTNDLRYIIIHVSEECLRRIEVGYKNIMSGNYKGEHADLYRDYCKVSFITNSRKAE